MADRAERVAVSMGQANAAVTAFNRELRDFARQVAPAEARTIQRKIALEGLRRLVMKTPVDTGRARGNWQVGIEQDPSQALDVTDKSGDRTIAQGAGPIERMPWCTCYITNNVEYIEALEAGHSGQAPQGMLAVTVAELRSMFP